LPGLPAGCELCGNQGCTVCKPGLQLVNGSCLDITPAATGASSGVPLSKVLPPVLVGSALIALVAFVWLRRLRMHNEDLSERLLTTAHELRAYRAVWEIDWKEVQHGDCVGRGAMGEVFRGQWRGMAVAVKVLTGVYLPLEELREEMDREATMLQTLRHAHVVQFLGAGTNSEGMPFLITELMDLGALTGLLRAGLRPPPRGGSVCAPVCVRACV
jgi:hypothetical protein